MPPLACLNINVHCSANVVLTHSPKTQSRAGSRRASCTGVAPVSGISSAYVPTSKIQVGCHSFARDDNHQRPRWSICTEPVQDMHEELRQRARDSAAAAKEARDALQASRACQHTAAQRLALEAERVHTLELMRLNGALLPAQRRSADQHQQCAV